MSRPKLFVTLKNLFLPDVCERAAKKSEIFSLLFHTHQVKQDFSFSQKVWDDSYSQNGSVEES
jgi:hypothetical protein